MVLSLLYWSAVDNDDVDETVTVSFVVVGFVGRPLSIVVIV